MCVLDIMTIIRTRGPQIKREFVNKRTLKESKEDAPRGQGWGEVRGCREQSWWKIIVVGKGREGSGVFV